MFYTKLESKERKTFRLHFIYSIIEGLIIGVTFMNEFVLLRSLEGSEFLVGLLFFVSMSVFMSLIILNELIRRTHNKKKLIRLTAIISRAPLFLFLFFPSVINGANSSITHILFLSIMFIYFLGTALTLPTINILLKENYRNNNFGKLYGYTATANKIAVLSATFIFGLLLNADFFIFRFIYPIVGLLSMIALFSLSKIPFSQKEIIIKHRLKTSLTNSIKRMISILKNNKQFMHFEMAFFSYGIAFMITATVITFFLESFLDLSYASISTYKSGAGIITVIALPIFGYWLDKVDPRKFGIITFASMLLYVLFVMLTEYLPHHIEFANIELYYTLIIAFIFFGIFGAAGTLSWNVGSAYFSKNINESGDYQAVHISLTGIRSMIAPLGVVIYKLLGYNYTFGISIIFITLAIVILIYSFP